MNFRKTNQRAVGGFSLLLAAFLGFFPSGSLSFSSTRVMDLFSGNNVYRPQWHPDPAKNKLTPASVAAVPPPPSRPGSFRFDLWEPAWQLAGAWVPARNPKLSVPGTVSPVPRVVPLRFNEYQFSPLWWRDAPWAWHLLNDLIPASFVAPSIFPSVPRTFRLDQFPADWLLIAPWARQAVPVFTKDASLPPLIPGQRFAWFQKTDEWQRDPQWAREILANLPPEIPAPPLLPPKSFAYHQKIEDWQLLAPWVDFLSRAILPPEPGVPSPLPPFGIDVFRPDQFPGDWILSAAWQQQFAAKLLPSTFIPPSQVLMRPAAFRADQFPDEWKLVRPWGPAPVLTPGDVSLLFMAPPATFRRDQFPPDWQLEMQWKVQRPMPPAAPGALLMVPQTFRAGFLPQEWSLVRPWVPQAKVTPRDASTPPLRPPQRFRQDQFPPVWALDQQWITLGLARILPPLFNLTPTPSKRLLKILAADRVLQLSPGDRILEVE